MDLPTADVLQASVARFLIDGQEEEAAGVLLSSTLEVGESIEQDQFTREPYSEVWVTLTGPRAAYDILERREHPITKAINRAFEAVLPLGYVLRRMSPRAQMLEIDPNWRSELLNIARGKGVHNQGVEVRSARPVLTWKNLRFRSQSEIRIAQALERAAVLFLPNCLARLGIPANRCCKEADFLVCQERKWGVIEVDGEPFHPPSRTAEDHERDRLFRAHGILVVEHFDASECFENSDGVVRRFLGILRKS